jgi:hypothetical protein
MPKETTKPTIYPRGDVRPEVTASHLVGWLYKSLDAHARSLPEHIKHAIVATVRSEFWNWEANKPRMQLSRPVKAMKATKTQKHLQMKAMKAMKAKKASGDLSTSATRSTMTTGMHQAPPMRAMSAAT